MKRHRVHFLTNEPQITKRFGAAVSLHSHTDRSREGFTGIQKYAEESFLIRMAVTRVSSKYRQLLGSDLDYPRAYFVPPLSPPNAYRLEAAQIEAMDLAPMVSITDHDNIDGSHQLQAFVDPETVPVSLEWTVPFGSSYFHVGVHNLPADRATEIVEGLTGVQCTYCSHSKISCVGGHGTQCFPRVHEWLEELSAIPETLIVLNHPLWDVSGIGETAHRELLSLFLKRYGDWIHALEVNGLRCWQENRDVMEIAERAGLPVISGGDRHGVEANGVVNLTAAETFSEFAREIRADKKSVILFLRQYQHPLLLRKLRVAWDVLKSSEGENGDRTRWKDRIFLPWLDGRVLPLSSHEWSATLASDGSQTFTLAR